MSELINKRGILAFGVAATVLGTAACGSSVGLRTASDGAEITVSSVPVNPTTTDPFETTAAPKTTDPTSPESSPSAVPSDVSGSSFALTCNNLSSDLVPLCERLGKKVKDKPIIQQAGNIVMAYCDARASNSAVDGGGRKDLPTAARGGLDARHQAQSDWLRQQYVNLRKHLSGQFPSGIPDRLQKAVPHFGELVLQFCGDPITVTPVVPTPVKPEPIPLPPIS